MREAENSGIEAKEGNPKWFFNLFELSDTEQLNLSRQVQEAKGIVRIFVHPYYDVYDPPAHSLKDARNAKLVREGLRRVLKANSNHIDQNPPTIIMEESGKETKIQAFLQPVVENLQAKIYFVPTEWKSSTPEVKNQEGKSLEEPVAWSYFLDKLKGLGVRKVIVGGMYLWSDFRGGGNGGEGSGCVGAAIGEISGSFEVQISHFNNPDSRSEVKGTEFEPYL